MDAKLKGGMDAKLKADWVTALRSGEYLQTTCKLYGECNTYCCLGVLNKIRGAAQTYEDFPRLMFDWTVLARMNDDAKKSFAQIADYIERNL